MRSQELLEHPVLKCGEHSCFHSLTELFFFKPEYSCFIMLCSFLLYSKVNQPLRFFQSPTCVQLFETLWTAARQASLSITNSQSLFKLMSIESVMPSNHLILCHPLLLPPSIFPSTNLHMHIFPLPWISFPFRSLQNSEQSSLSYLVGSH